jgi:PPOX class probable F420-dependent enzyme
MADRPTEPERLVKSRTAESRGAKAEEIEYYRLPSILFSISMSKYNESSRRLIEGKNFAFLATINADGSPHVTPTWVDSDGQYILINTTIGRVKERNMKRTPVVAISIAEQTNPYTMVTMRGRVVESVTGPEAERHIDLLAKKYLGVERNPYRKPGERRILFKIKADWTSGAS